MSRINRKALNIYENILPACEDVVMLEIAKIITRRFFILLVAVV